jgi:hypothetical protein
MEVAAINQSDFDRFFSEGLSSIKSRESAAYNHNSVTHALILFHSTTKAM